MGFDLSGFVLRPIRTAPANALTTDEAVNGVATDFKPLPEDYTIQSNVPDLVDVAAEQYRASTLYRTEDGQTEYILWAANTSNTYVREGLAVEVGNPESQDAAGSKVVVVLSGSESVYDDNAGEPVVREDGSIRFSVRDVAGQSVSSVSSILVRRGDDGSEISFTSNDLSFNPTTGIAALTNSTKIGQAVASAVSLSGGISKLRGDKITVVYYTLASVRFWWSRNDRYETRFQWDGLNERWAPLRGGAPRNLGRLLPDSAYVLSPNPNAQIGSYLTGNSDDPDDYCMVRLGVRPDAASVPVAEPVAPSGFGGILVVTDEEAEEEYDFLTLAPTASAVMGQATGTLQWNPAFLDEYAGQVVWYSYRSFGTANESVSLGGLEGADLEPLFLAPIPAPTEYPFIRIGNRNPLEAVLVDTDALLFVKTIEEGQVGLSLSTGRLKFSAADIAKSDPESATFNASYLGSVVFYTGIAMTPVPVEMRAPVRLVGSSGTPSDVSEDKKQILYVPDAIPLPSPGISGVQHIPDRTGGIPDPSIDPSIRANGSNLIREVRGDWDLILFSDDGRVFRRVIVVDDDEEIPRFPFRRAKGDAYLNLNLGSGGSAVKIGKDDRKRFQGQKLWFRQSAVQPAVYAPDARIYSRVRDNVTLLGTETFRFAVNGTEYAWDAASDFGGVATSAGGTFTVAEIATSLAAASDPDVIKVRAARLVIQSPDVINGAHVGSVEIGFGPDSAETPVDPTGTSALGFLPAWRVVVDLQDPSNDRRWLPDSGIHVGIRRSPLNLDGTQDIPDVKHRAAISDVPLSEDIPGNTVVLLDKIPLEDEPGYDEDVFFRLEAGLSQKNLEHYDEVLHEFGLGRFMWIDQETTFQLIEQPVLDLNLGKQSVVPDSFRLPGKGLFVSAFGGPFEQQALGTDFLLPFAGAPGSAKLIEVISGRSTLGALGQFTAGLTTFRDPGADTDFVALGAGVGYQLKITTGDAQGTYIVTAAPTDPKELQITPAFPRTGNRESWELYEGVDKETNDLSIVASEIFTEFNHLPEEPFKIRVLSPLGPLPADAASQDAGRLVGVFGDALANSRPISIRFGLPPGSPEASLVRLGQEFLGSLQNALVVPTPTDERFVNESFSIRVGTKTYTFADGNIVKVPGVLTIGLAGDIIEVQDISGILNFGSEVFTQFQGADVYYVEGFSDPDLAPTDLPPGTVEYRADDGVLNFNGTDLATYAGMETHLVEQMVTEAGLDVALNPLNGSFLFTKPLREQQIVEVEYFQAAQGTGEQLLVPDPNFIALQAGDEAPLVPVEVVEVLPLFVRQEVATKPEVPPNSIVPQDFKRVWRFNPTERTVRDDIEPQVYINNNLCNVGGSASPVCTFDYVNSRILFQETQPDDADVLITYSVNEAFGGEASYTVSTFPVYRPPFFIEANKTEFVLESDRTDDVVPGKIMRVGAAPLYITGSTFDGENTTVEFFPETETEIGSRAPGNDTLSLLSDRPIVKAHNPAAGDGYWRVIDVPYEPVNKGFTSITFSGDLTALAVPGYLLEMAGYPFIVSGSSLTEDGLRTVINMTTPSPTGFFSGQDEARLSIRPVYPPSPALFVGVGAVLPEEEFEAVLFGEKDTEGNDAPGRTLRLTLDYALDFNTGAIEFLAPTQAPLGPLQTLYFRRTQVDVLAPFIADNAIVNPRFLARFVHAIAPSEDNGLRGKILRASYTYSAPDTFYWRTLPLTDYMGEIASEISADVANQLPSNGASPSIPPAIRNETQGTLGLRAQIESLYDEDRAARVFIDFYNNVVLAFEQVQETISGGIIGDRDGKFKFFVGRGINIPPPGYEDAISGRVNTRNIFSELFFAYNHKLIFLTRDPLVEPDSASLNVDKIEGRFMDPDFLGELARQQREFAQNDIDDLVLVKRNRIRIVSLIPFRIEATGRYERLGDPNRFSRLFPQRAEAFFLTAPGIGSDLDATPVEPGVYAFRKRVSRLSFKGGLQLPKRASTFRKTIAEVSNPVLGSLEGISRFTLRERLPRARVFRYSETGFPELDDDLNAAGFDNFTDNPRPAVIASILPLHEFPLRADGMPDIKQLIAQGGGLPDLTTGDADLVTPPFEGIVTDNGSYPMLAFGRPNGDIIDVGITDTLDIAFLTFSSPVFKKMFVGEVMLGCVITFSDDKGEVVTEAGDVIQLGEEPEDGEPLVLSRGDTIFVTPPDVDLEPADPPDNETTAVSAEGLPGYRIGFDVKLDRGDGEVVDITFPSFKDPSIFGLKEMFGQKPPKPLDHMEADVSFRNSLVSPAPLPALLGQPLNDSGDYTLPYLVAGNTEIDRLGEVARAFDLLLALDTPNPSAVYPDEVLGNDGAVIGTYVDGGLQAGALITTQDATPVLTAGGAYTPHSGIGDVESFDFLFIQTGQAGILPDAQGMLSVGSVESDGVTSVIEPPRFVTPTGPATRFRYVFNNALSYILQPATPAPPGMRVQRIGTDTIFDCTSISPGFLVFNDGTAPPSVTGGLNDIINPPDAGFAYPANGNVIRIHLWTADDGVNPVTFLQTITIAMNGALAPTVDGDLGTPVIGPGGVTFDQQVLTIDSAAFVTLGAGGLPLDPTNPPYTVPLWFTIDVDTSAAGGAGVGGASFTGHIDRDRLSFVESYDLRSVRSRNDGPVDAVSVVSELSVTAVSGPGGAEDITVNAPVEVNGGAPFTWNDRANIFPFTGGEFDFTLGEGRIKVMAFEGHGNVEIEAAEPLIFSALPSSLSDENGVIATGSGLCEGGLTDFDNRLQTSIVGITGGSLDNVEPGDVCHITRAADPSAHATAKAGTYLVKHAIQPDPASSLKEFAFRAKTLPMNSTASFIAFTFPKITEFQALAFKIFVDVAELSNGDPMWLPPAAGTRIYVLPDLGDITKVISVEYTFYDAAAGEFHFDPLTIEDADGGGLGIADLLNAAQVGAYVSGFSFAEVRPDRGTGQPRNLVGWRQQGAVPSHAAYGFKFVSLFNPKLDPPAISGEFPGGTKTFDFAAALDGPILESAGDPLADEIRIIDATPIANTTFDPDPDAVVYESVPGRFAFNLSQPNWDDIHGNTAGASEVNCLFPSDEIMTVDGSGGGAISGAPPGFSAQAGVFFEPSVPRPTLDLATGGAKVVDATHSLAAGQIGMRPSGAFGIVVSPEFVTFAVRRPRRYHVAQDNIGELLTPLRFAYEIRKGTIDAFGPDTLPPQNEEWPYVIEAAGATQLGAFDDEDVNVNPGDFFRLLDANGTVEQEVEIGAVVDSTRLALKAPGLFPVVGGFAGRSFEIYLRKPPVPHLQSNQQLLDLLTDEVVLERTADYSMQDGGWVPTESDPQAPRRLKDTDTSINFAAIVQEGDIVIIDPAGDVEGPGGLPATGQERGTRPFGDRSVPTRLVAQPGQEVPYLAGGPAELDDNRGWYRVSTVSTTDVEVEANNVYAGPAGGPVTFGTDAEYAVYPTITGSTAHFADPPGFGNEGQNDLRPTGFAGEFGSPPDSYQGNLFSIGPFSYRIIRPSALFSDEAVDLILMMRERMLSFVEEFDSLLTGRKFGSYFVFQRDSHIADLGNPLIPDDGLGVMSNALIRGIQGETQISPYANTSDSLSVLGRRFWVNDYRLDGETPPFQAGVPTYATLESNDGNPVADEGDGRPVLPDQIDEILNTNDQFRPLRLAWIDYRVNREDGKLAEIRFNERRLPKNLARQRRALRQKKTTDSI